MVRRDGAHRAIRRHRGRNQGRRARRIAVFAEEYGLATVDGLVNPVIRRQPMTCRHVRALAERGLEPQRSWVAEGRLDELAARVRWSRDNRALFG